jgi:hypothetical protein
VASHPSTSSSNMLSLMKRGENISFYNQHRQEKVQYILWTTTHDIWGNGLSPYMASLHNY